MHVIITYNKISWEEAKKLIDKKKIQPEKHSTMHILSELGVIHNRAEPRKRNDGHGRVVQWSLTLVATMDMSGSIPTPVKYWFPTPVILELFDIGLNSLMTFDREYFH